VRPDLDEEVQHSAKEGALLSGPLEVQHVELRARARRGGDTKWE